MTYPQFLPLPLCPLTLLSSLPTLCTCQLTWQGCMQGLEESVIAVILQRELASPYLWGIVGMYLAGTHTLTHHHAHCGRFGSHLVHFAFRAVFCHHGHLPFASMPRPSMPSLVCVARHPHLLPHVVLIFSDLQTYW
jgi:hypothetical protein